jgi:hypothetical protein
LGTLLICSPLRLGEGLGVRCFLSGKKAALPIPAMILDGIFVSMNRNYDEIIAEMLIQIDRHSEELTKQSAEQTRQSQRAEESHQLLVQELQNLRQNFLKEVKDLRHDFLKEVKDIRQDFLKEVKDLRHDFTEADTQLSAQLVHSATILDRIIKRNNLGL